jgi:cell division initiation protein
MPLTPYDIHNKEFKRSFRGYDVDEVNDFLDQIIRDFEILTREKLELQQQMDDLQTELDRVLEGDMVFQTDTHSAMQAPGQHQGYMSEADTVHSSALSSMEQSIHKSIRVAQEVAEEVRLNAKKEAELVLQEAEKNADRIINEALQKARIVHSELVDLKQKAVVYRARFKTLVQSHLDVLDSSDWESLEELEDNLEERGKQLEEYAERSPELTPDDRLNQEYVPHVEETKTKVLDEVAAAYLDEEDEPHQEMRRTSRKLKKKIYR